MVVGDDRAIPRRGLLLVPLPPAVAGPPGIAQEAHLEGVNPCGVYQLAIGDVDAGVGELEVKS